MSAHRSLVAVGCPVVLQTGGTGVRVVPLGMCMVCCILCSFILRGEDTHVLVSQLDQNQEVVVGDELRDSGCYVAGRHIFFKLLG